MDIVDLQYSKYSHLLSDLSCKFKLSMTIFNYKNVKTQNMPFVLIKLGDNTCEYIPKKCHQKSDINYHVTLNTILKVIINLIVYLLMGQQMVWEVLVGASKKPITTLVRSILLTCWLKWYYIPPYKHEYKVIYIPTIRLPLQIH